MSTDRRSADLVALFGAVIVAAASFAPQFRYRAADLDGGCSAWTACLGWPVEPSPDITTIMRWLCLAGIVVAIAPIALAWTSLRGRLVRAQVVSAWAVIIGVIALMVVPTWQERWTSMYESNREFVILPDWGLAGVLVGLLVVLTAAVKASATPD